VNKGTGVDLKKGRQKYLTMDFGSVSVSPVIVRKEVIGGVDMTEALGETRRRKLFNEGTKVDLSRTCPGRSV
jgi:hypothetical protein